MMNKNTRRGFTLIELLVVVLIIGILAAVALPQYRAVVIKSRIATMLPLMKNMADAEEVYYLAHGEYADHGQVLALDITMPNECKYQYNNIWPCGSDLLLVFSNSDALFLSYCPEANETLDTCRDKQEFAIVKFYNYSSDNADKAGTWACVVHHDSSLGKRICSSLALN